MPGRTADGEPPATPPSRAEGSDPDAALAHVRRVVAESGTSFSLGMKMLGRARRDAMYAVYAFCREVDDIADDETVDAETGTDDRLARLADWRAEIDGLYAGRPTRLTARALAGPVRDYALPKAEFLAVIEGMEMDAREAMCAPPPDALRHYCRCVAGAVGLLSIRVFGARGEEGEAFALALGEALQLTNILRDLDEDAARGRLYLPADVLAAHGLDGAAPPAVLAHPALDPVCRTVAGRARARFAEADRLLALSDRRVLRPALLMMGIYERILDRLLERGWQPPRAGLRLSKAEKLWAAFRHGLWRTP
ncbi:MAG: presqualene diphosphate synthase HpnD [Alphaproteobacteria bacterium]|nr:presqualene diphosphate synthase HpnD [Alphaproteobacteria bacterium]